MSEQSRLFFAAMGISVSSYLLGFMFGIAAVSPLVDWWALR